MRMSACPPGSRSRGLFLRGGLFLVQVAVGFDRARELQARVRPDRRRRIAVAAWEGEHGCLTTSLPAERRRALIEAFDTLLELAGSVVLTLLTVVFGLLIAVLAGVGGALTVGILLWGPQREPERSPSCDEISVALIENHWEQMLSGEKPPGFQFTAITSRELA